MTKVLNNGPLGKEVRHAHQYSPDHLFSIPRRDGRKELGVGRKLPFVGVDIWNAYEVSWLGPKGKPCVAMAEIRFSCTTEYMIESKSLKLYLNSLNQTRFASTTAVVSTMKTDLRKAANGQVSVSLTRPSQFLPREITEPRGTCIDEQDIDIDQYHVNPGFLISEGPKKEEKLYSRLLRTNCPVTGQPDWADIVIDYSGPRINREGLLRYIVSFREHSGFHENCVEQIFMDVTRRCRPDKLSVYARFTRRGGIDINPFRASFYTTPHNRRTTRQ